MHQAWSRDIRNCTSDIPKHIRAWQFEHHTRHRRIHPRNRRHHHHHRILRPRSYDLLRQSCSEGRFPSTIRQWHCSKAWHTTRLEPIRNSRSAFRNKERSSLHFLAFSKEQLVTLCFYNLRGFPQALSILWIPSHSILYFWKICSKTVFDDPRLQTRHYTL